MGVNSVDGHRRRIQRDMNTEALDHKEETVKTPEAQQEQSPANPPEQPRRRRRAQPPQQITQKIPRIREIDVHEIPRLPNIEEPEKKEKKKPVKMKGKKHQKMRKSPHLPVVSPEKAAMIGDAASKAGKTALKTLVDVLLLVAVSAAAGGKKLASLIGQIKEKRDAGKAAQLDAAARQEVVLEAIRPEDYHGRGALHAQEHMGSAHKVSKTDAAKEIRKLKKKLAKLDTQRLISAALVVVALVSAWQIASILFRTFRTTRLNAQLSEQYGASMSADTQDEDAAYDDGMTEEAFVVYTGETEETEPVTEPAIEMAEPEQTQAPVEPEATPEAPEEHTTPAPEVVKTTKYHRMGGDALPEMEALYNENRDLVAWINIPEVIDLPVVYKDNSYYLKRDFYKQKNTAGTLFLDENHPFKEKAQNLLLHGHNMKDGTMFGRLTQYINDRTYIKNHPFINLSTLWKKEQYVIFAVLDVSLDPRNEKFFNYFTHHTFSSDAEFTSYVRQLQLRSMYAIPIDVAPSDALLTLSTCLEDNRLVIVARRLRNGETRSELRQRIHTATRQ